MIGGLGFVQALFLVSLVGPQELRGNYRLATFLISLSPPLIKNSETEEETIHP